MSAGARSCPSRRRGGGSPLGGPIRATAGRVRDPVRRQASRTVRLAPRVVEALKSHPTSQAEEKLRTGGRYRTELAPVPKERPPKIVSETLGHASVAITLDTYSHMLPGMGGEAADAMGEALG